MPSSVGLQVCQRPSYCIYRTAPKHHLCMHAAPTLLRGVRHARLWAAAQLRMSLEMHYIRLSVRGLALPYAVRYSSAAPFLPRSFCLYRYRFSFSPSVFLLFFPFLLLLFFCLCIICPLLGAPRLFRSVYRCRTQGFFPLPAAGFVRRSIWPIITCPLPR